MDRIFRKGVPVNRSILLLAALAPIAFAQTLTLKVAGASRTTTLHVPTSGLSKPALVFVLHGLGGDGPGMQSSTQMDKVADREKFVVAYPNAVGGTWDYAGAKNDYAFLKAIIDSTVARYQVDRNRVYVSGFSQGGGEAVYAAFSYPDVYAAVAPVSSVGSGAPTPKRPIPILLTFGTNDLYTPATFMASVASWLKIDSCATTPVVVRPYPATNAKSVVTRLTYGKCAQGTEIVVDSIQGGGHEWPNNTATKVNNAEEVWAFFKNFTLDRASTSVRDGFVAARPLSASYQAGMVHVAGIDGNCQLRIADPSGRILATARSTDGRFAFSARPNDVYLIEVAQQGFRQTVRMVAP
jgi:poly(3-hydroxybutyrate) depolymerase